MGLMMRRWIDCALLLLLPLSALASTPEVVYLQPPRSDADATHSFYHDLLHIVLPTGTQIEIRGSTIPQKRSMELVKSGTYTIGWSGTNSLREKDLLPVRVPLFAGLLGIRMPVIRRSDQTRFDMIRNAEDLKQLVACQGAQWPDSDILEANGYRVERVTSFERMYRMLEAGRCDYFPRGITEIYGELDRNVYPGLMAYDRVLLSYTFPMYFFVAHGNEALAELLEERLTQFAENGDLHAYLRQHPVTRGAFPLARFRDSLVFRLENPDLPAATPLSNRSFWLQLPPETPRETETEITPLAGFAALYP